MDILQAAGGPDTAEAWLARRWPARTKIMGFGHRVYKTGDVRAAILKAYARQAAAAAGLEKWEETAEIIENLLGREKNLYPNLDWPAGRLYHALGLGDPALHADLRHGARRRLGGACHRTTRAQPPHPAALALHGVRVSLRSTAERTRLTIRSGQNASK